MDFSIKPRLCAIRPGNGAKCKSATLSAFAPFGVTGGSSIAEFDPGFLGEVQPLVDVGVYERPEFRR
jgi:hypothetical protein